MKKILTLAAILFLPAILYLYFSLGIPKIARAPVYGPRSVREVVDSATGKPSVDTVFYTIPRFQCLAHGGVSFDSQKKLNGRSYVAIFLPPDSTSTMLAQLGQDIKLNRASYAYVRFVFFRQTDTAGTIPLNAADIGHDLGLGADTAMTVYLQPQAFDSLLVKHYFVADPTRKKDPWQTSTDAILIDRLGRIRGYYNIRYAPEVKRMKEDAQHIFLHDEEVQTIEESKVEQKR